MEKGKTTRKRAKAKKKESDVRFVTRQVGQIKTIIESIKDLLQDVNIQFVSPGDPDCDVPGVYINAMDSSHIALVYLSFPKDDIEQMGEFVCKKSVCAGVELPTLARALKTFSEGEEVVMELNDNSDTIMVKAHNENKEVLKEAEISLLDIDADDIQVPSEFYEFANVLAIKSSDFQKMIKDVSASDGEHLYLGMQGGKFIIGSKGDTMKYRQVFKQKQVSEVSEESSLEPPNKKRKTDKSAGPQWRATNPDKLHDMKRCNIYPLRYLLQIIKASSISEEVTIYLKEKQPLLLEWRIPALGVLRFVLCPQVMDDEDEPEKGKDKDNDVVMESIAEKGTKPDA